MSEYADSFAQNDIDLDVLPELTDQDLERLDEATDVAGCDRHRDLGLCQTILRVPPALTLPTSWQRRDS